MPIKAVLFDLDDTLAPETSLTRTALTQAADAVRVQHLSPSGLARGRAVGSKPEMARPAGPQGATRSRHLDRQRGHRFA